MIFRPVMRFNGRYEKRPRGQNRDAPRRRSLTQKCQFVHADIRARACVVDSVSLFFAAAQKNSRPAGAGLLSPR